MPLFHSVADLALLVFLMRSAASYAGQRIPDPLALILSATLPAGLVDVLVIGAPGPWRVLLHGVLAGAFWHVVGRWCEPRPSAAGLARRYLVVRTGLVLGSPFHVVAEFGMLAQTLFWISAAVFGLRLLLGAAWRRISESRSPAPPSK